MRKDAVLTAVGLLASIMLLGCKAASEGEALFSKKCGVCHPTSRAEEKKKTRAEWAETVKQMRGHGADVSDEEAAKIVEFLSETHGK